MAGHFAPTPLFGEGSGSTALPMPAAYLKLLIRRYGREPLQANRLLAETGISPKQAEKLDSDDSVVLWQLLRVIQNLLATGRSDFVLDVAEALQGQAHGPLAVAIASAGDLEQGLAVLERFGHLRAPHFRVQRATEGANHSIHIEFLPELKLDLARSLAEAVLVSFKAMIESALGEPMKEARIEFPFATPPYADRYEQVFKVPISFVPQEPSVATLKIPVAWLGLACPFANRSHYLRAVAELEAAERIFDGSSLVVARVKHILEASEGSPPSAEEVAGQLHLSRRTLVRRLAEQKTSFRAVVDGHLRQRAERLLADQSLTVAEIGYRLGYTDSANFGRACRRWFGCAPSAHP